MTKYLLFSLAFLALSCVTDVNSEDSINENSNSNQPEIYVKFTSESKIISYSDDNSCTPANVVEGVSYGPCTSGTFRFTVKLLNGKEFNVSRNLSSPDSGIRTYHIRFYYDTKLNRWLVTHDFIDSN